MGKKKVGNFTVGIDIRPLESSTKNRGIGYYTSNLLSEMLRQKDPDYQFILYKTLTGSTSSKLDLKDGDMFYGLPTLLRPRRGIRRFDPLMGPFWKKALKDTKPDLLHLTSFFEVYYLTMPQNIKTIVTLHDLIPMLFPKWCFDNELAKKWYISRLEKIKKCSKIITISNSAKEDIIKILRVPEDQVVVVYGGLDSRFKVISKENIEKVLKKYKIQGRYLLSVGAPSRHKNMPRVFSAFKDYILQSGDSSLKLVVVCKLLPFEEEVWNKEKLKLGIKDNVVFTNFVSDQEMPAIYSGAEALLFPSLYEGFGLPILEAMACGIPVITSNVSSMPEVAGAAAVYVNPESTEEITKAIREVIENKKLRGVLVKKGMEQAKKFTWEEAARKTLRVYKSVLES